MRLQGLQLSIALQERGIEKNQSCWSDALGELERACTSKMTESEQESRWVKQFGYIFIYPFSFSLFIRKHLPFQCCSVTRKNDQQQLLQTVQLPRT